MKLFIRTIPFIFCTLVMAAHLFRANLIIMMFISILIPLILIWKNRISIITVQIALIIYGLEWIRSMLNLISIRIETGENWHRLAIILGVVALLNFASIIIFRSRYIKEMYPKK